MQNSCSLTGYQIIEIARSALRDRHNHDSGCDLYSELDKAPEWCLNMMVKMLAFQPSIEVFSIACKIVKGLCEEKIG